MVQADRSVGILKLVTGNPHLPIETADRLGPSIEIGEYGVVTKSHPRSCQRAKIRNGGYINWGPMLFILVDGILGLR
jgi:hypothetical protein